MILVFGGLGGSLFGMLPLCLQYAVWFTHPVSMNVSSGMIYNVAMVVAAIGHSLTGHMAPEAFVSWLCVFVTIEVYLYWSTLPTIRPPWATWKPPAPEEGDAAEAAATPFPLPSLPGSSPAHRASTVVM